MYAIRSYYGSGAASYALTAVSRDTAAPALSFETPRAVDTVNGTVLLSGYAEDASPIVGVEYSRITSYNVCYTKLLRVGGYSAV